jgi:hypothetical protein
VTVDRPAVGRPAFLALISDLVEGARAIATVDSAIATIARNSALWRG